MMIIPYCWSTASKALFEVQEDALAVREGGGDEVAGTAVAELEFFLECRGALGEVADGEVGLGLG